MAWGGSQKGWAEALEGHLSVARRIHPPEKIAQLAEASGIPITTDGNGAADTGDVGRYLTAVEQVLGKVAVTSAKLKIMNKARDLGLMGG